MSVGDPRVRLVVRVGPAEAAGVRELEADEQVVGAAEPLAVGVEERLAEVTQVVRVTSSITSWFGLARPSARTAIASPPQMSLAPLSPKLPPATDDGLRRVPVDVPSQPSIGCAVQRLPIVRPYTSAGRRSGDSASVSIASSQSRSMPSWDACSRNSAADRMVATRLYSVGGIGYLSSGNRRDTGRTTISPDNPWDARCARPNRSG